MEPRTRETEEKLMSERGGEVFCSTCKKWHAVNENLEILGIAEDAYGQDEYSFVCPTTKKNSLGTARIRFGEI